MAKIGHFEILELVGRGAMGAVYRAVDPIIGRVVAIKVIRLIGYNDGEEAAFLKERLFKEARAAGGLSHPGIVTVYQLGTHDSEAYIVMEYIDGSTLESRLASGTPPIHRSAPVFLSTLPRHSITPTNAGSFTAISSRRISCLRACQRRAPAPSKLPISGSPKPCSATRSLRPG